MHPLKFLSPNPTAPSKPLFVFLPGMDGSGRLLRPQIEGLTPWFDIRCLALGQKDTTEWPLLARQVSQLISQELAAVPTEQKRSVYLCGESFGGCLAMQVLSLSPHLFDRIILVNPASSFRRLPWMQLGPLITRRLPNVAYRYSSKGMVPFLIEPSRVSQRDRVALANAMESVPAKTAALRMSLLSEFEVERLPLERMNHPVLLIAGGNDRLLPSKRETKSLLARFPNARLVLLPNSGHACLLETETNLVKILSKADFL
ncbi:MAG: alpha/beta hydrolase [Cyanobacteria bacterium P01_C01_bin.69]